VLLSGLEWNINTAVKHKTINLLIEDLLLWLFLFKISCKKETEILKLLDLFANGFKVIF